MTMGLTGRQAEALAFIRSFINEHRRSPSLNEVAEGVGLRARSGAARLLAGLRARGHIDWQPHKARSIVVLSGDTSAGTYALPALLQAALLAYCAATGDRPADVVVDAVRLHLDQVGPREPVS